MSKKKNRAAVPIATGFHYVRAALSMPVAVKGLVRRGKIVGKEEMSPEDTQKSTESVEKNKDGIDQANKAIWNHVRGPETKTPDFPLVGGDKNTMARLDSKLPKETKTQPRKPASQVDMTWIKDQKSKLAQKSEDTDVEGLLWLYTTEDGIAHLEELSKAEKKFKPGDRVKTTMGVRLSGTIVKPFDWHSSTDGTYKAPEINRGYHPVEWSDGTKGYHHQDHMELEAKKEEVEKAESAGKPMDKMPDKDAIESPNSSGQGFSASHEKNPFHKIITSHGYQYSHSTPVGRTGGKGEVKNIHHTYELPGSGNRPGNERKVGVHEDKETGAWNWESSINSGSSVHTRGTGPQALDSHLKRVARPVKKSSEELVNEALAKHLKD